MQLITVTLTSAGDALLVDLAEVCHTALIGSRPHALPVHGGPGHERRLGDRKLLQDT